MAEISKQHIRKNPDFAPPELLDYNRYLVISIGTGECKPTKRYTADIASKWGLFGWWFNACSGSTPLVDIFTQASTDLVDYHLSVVFKALDVQKHYLRIQVSFYVKALQLITYNRRIWTIKGRIWGTLPEKQVFCKTTIFVADFSTTSSQTFCDEVFSY